jgi:hypothetical protein
VVPPRPRQEIFRRGDDEHLGLLQGTARGQEIVKGGQSSVISCAVQQAGVESLHLIAEILRTPLDGVHDLGTA